MKISVKHLQFILLLPLAFLSWLDQAHAFTRYSSQEKLAIEASVAEFFRHPERFRRRLPEKFIKKVGSDGLSFVPLQISRHVPSGAKAILRESLRDLEIPLSSRDTRDRLEDFLSLYGEDLSLNLKDLEGPEWRAAEIDTRPWSDSYWPFFKGGLGQRYNDPLFELKGMNKFKNYYDYVHSEGYRFLDLYRVALETSSADSLLRLSPSEKYDLLVGDLEAKLTRQMWDDGLRYYAQSPDGEIAKWMGHCHGWAVAAIKESRPAKTIRLIAADGKTELIFYPSDIKALTSLIWSNGFAEKRFLGMRCNAKDPIDDERGRPLEDKCVDVNPATWHLVLLHMLGQKKESFVMDAKYDHEVWNHPVFSYSLNYIHLKSGKVLDLIEEALLPREEWPADPFKDFRDEKARYILGVAADIGYVSETNPTARESDSQDNDEIFYVRYFYDLELDEDLNLVGGEWYQKQHPDFLWKVADGVTVRSVGDILATGEWDPKQAVPLDFQLAAKGVGAFPGASAYGQPLYPIVKKMLELSQSETQETEP